MNLGEDTVEDVAAGRRESLPPAGSVIELDAGELYQLDCKTEDHLLFTCTRCRAKVIYRREV